MQDSPKAVWSIPYVSVAFFPILKRNLYEEEKETKALFVHMKLRYKRQRALRTRHRHKRQKTVEFFYR